MDHTLSIVYVSCSLAIFACASAITLSVQRGIHHKANEEGPISLNASTDHPLETDHRRDYSIPYSDSNRITRITCCTLILTALAALDLHAQVTTNGDEVYYSITSSVCILVTWLYISVLTLLSRHYRLPNKWGWILNSHLFLLYTFAWVVQVFKFCQAVIIQFPQMSWLHALPFLLPVILGFDLIFATATVKQGPPYIDKNGRKVCTKNVESIFSKMYLSWITNIVNLVAEKKGDLKDADLPSLTPSFRAHNLFYKFGATRNGNNHHLLYRLIKANSASLAAQMMLAVAASGLYYAPAFFMNRLLQLFQDYNNGVYSEPPKTYGAFLVVGMGAAVFATGATASQQWFYSAAVLETRVKTILNIEVYRKSLRRRDLSTTTTTTKKEEDNNKNAEEDNLSSTGAIVNLIGTDSSRIANYFALWFAIIACPLELITGFYFLYKIMGVSCFYGLLVMIIILPINHFNAKIFAKTQDHLMEARDKRVSLMSEILHGIRQIKFFAWETNWEARIMDARNAELKQLSKTYINGVFFSFVWQGAPIFVTLLTFYAYTKIEGKELNAAIAFTAISVFNELRYALNSIPESFIDGIQAYSSLKRIQKFIDEDEIDPVVPQVSCEAVEISFTNASIGWKKPEVERQQLSSEEEQSNGFVLKNLNICFPNNELSLISGATGSGKSLLLLSLLGEAVLLDGKAACPRTPVADTIYSAFGPLQSENIDPQDWVLDRSLAYVSQTPWLQSISIRSNILFGLPYIESRYKETLYACALDKDLAIFEDGDRTEIGEKGITLSGGQKARVALARAVYSRAKNILMDDVLSAVDAHTAKHVYQECLLGPLMKNRTRILVTHHVKLCLKGSSYLVHIEDGRTAFAGSVERLKDSGQLAHIMEEDKHEDEKDAEEEEAIEDGSLIPLSVSGKDNQKAARVLIEEETKASGSVKLRLYKIYFSLVGNVVFWICMAILVIGTRIIETGESWWLKIWAQAYDTYSSQNDTFAVFDSTVMSVMPMRLFAASNVKANLDTYGNTPPTHSTPSDGNLYLNYYLSVYALIACSSVILDALRYIYLYWAVLGANKRLYANLLHRVFRAPLRFFDTTPTGRILSRFSKDFESADSKVPSDLLAFIIQSVLIISTACTICIVIPSFTLPMLCVIAINIGMSRKYIASSVELRRLDSVSRSPIFSNFTETISGVATIRAFGASQQFLQVMMDRIDENARPFFYSWAVTRWASMRYSTTSAIINFFASAIALYNIESIDVPLVGFGLSFVLVFTEYMYRGVRHYTDLEMSFNSIERITELMEIEQEAPAVTSIRPPLHWPTHGEVQVRNLTVRYAADLDPVLKGISFSVKPQEKIGVVGRTGSGKSTLALSIFRFMEACEGSVVIDGIDIKDLGTEDLRSNLTIIPQDPTLFSGTLRSNLDPFNQFKDQDIFTSLKRVHLVPSSFNPNNNISSSSGNNDDGFEIEGVNVNVFKNLDASVSEGGKNFSQGQRQLLCLACALLKRSRIVLMDEATASVDFETDKAIQKTIATEFSESTVLCIAHRLHTVIEYDKILLLDQGEILEFESPLTLINDPDSSFYKMCRNSGEFDTLLELAKSRYQHRL